MLRVYIGSFWNEPLVHESLAVLFETEENDLMKVAGALEQHVHSLILFL